MPGLLPPDPPPIHPAPTPLPPPRRKLRHPGSQCPQYLPHGAVLCSLPAAAAAQGQGGLEGVLGPPPAAVHSPVPTPQSGCTAGGGKVMMLALPCPLQDPSNP